MKVATHHRAILSKNIFCIALATVLFAPCFHAEAQQQEKNFRIGYLDRTTAVASAVLADAFRHELSKLGWIEGKNITIEYRFAEQRLERLPQLAAELVRLKVDVIVTGGFGPAQSAKEATTTIPVVLAQDPDPVGNGLIVSLGRPGGNITGLSASANELGTKRLEILKDVIPQLSRVAYLRSSDDTVQNRLALKEIRAAALALQLKLDEIDTHPDIKGLESAFKTAKQKQANAILLSSVRTFLVERRRIVELADMYRLAAIYPQKEFVDQGGLMFYGVDYVDLYRRAAGYVDKIFKGAKPADLPVQQATKFEFIINLKAAKQIGLTIPPNVLARADRVIK